MNLLGNKPIIARPFNFWEKLVRHTKRNKVLCVFSALLFVLAVVSVCFTITYIWQEDEIKQKSDRLKKETMKLLKSMVQHHNNRGLIYKREKNWTIALKEYKIAIFIIEKNNLKNPRPYVNRGALFIDLMKNENNYAELQQKNNIEKDLKMALRIDPYHLKAHLNMGFFFEYINEKEQAIESFNNVVKYKSEISLTYKEDLAEKKNKIKKQRENTIANAYYRLAYIYENQNQNQNQKAVNYYNKALKWAPDNIKIRLDRADLYEKIGLHKEAISDHQKVIKRAPDNSDCRQNLGYLYFKIKSYREALKQYEHFVKLNPRNPEAYFYRGYAYEKQKKYAKAFSNYKTALELDSSFQKAKNRYEKVKKHIAKRSKY